MDNPNLKLDDDQGEPYSREPAFGLGTFTQNHGVVPMKCRMG